MDGPSGDNGFLRKLQISSTSETPIRIVSVNRIDKSLVCMYVLQNQALS